MKMEITMQVEVEDAGELVRKIRESYAGYAQKHQLPVDPEDDSDDPPLRAMSPEEAVEVEEDALAEFFPTFIEFRQAALLYPPPQIPRALMALPMAMLVAAGLPFLAAMLGLVSVVWAVILTALLVQQMYRLESILPAMIGGACQALFQFLILAIVFAG